MHLNARCTAGALRASVLNPGLGRETCRRSRRRRHPRAAPTCLLPLFAGLLLLAGCAYRLGPTNGVSAGARSIQIQPFENKTVEPRLVEAVTAALRKQLQQDGTYKINTSDGGDIVVMGSILNYERHSLTFVSRDVRTPRDYRLTITAHVTARERATGRVVLDRKLTGYSDIRIGPDQTSAERQALPLVAADLARNTTALLVDGSW